MDDCVQWALRIAEMPAVAFHGEGYTDKSFNEKEQGETGRGET